MGSHRDHRRRSRCVAAAGRETLGRSQQTAAAIVGAADTPSVAVLPFASLSDDPDDIYFAAGLSGELLSQLSHIEGLKVAGSVSSFQFKDRAESPADVAGRSASTTCWRAACAARAITSASPHSHRRQFRLQPLVADVRARVPRHLCDPGGDRSGRRQALQVRLLESETQRLRLRGTRRRGGISPVPDGYRAAARARRADEP